LRSLCLIGVLPPKFPDFGPAPAVVAIGCGILVLASQRLDIECLDEAGASLGIIALALSLILTE
jgi:hypothetical protein